MSSRPLLSGEVQVDETVLLRREIVGLEAALQEANDELARVKQASKDAMQAVAALRKSPLKEIYDVCRVIFGEISRVEADDISDSSALGSRDPKWEQWKQLLGGKPSEFIDLLLVNRKMTITQLAAAGRCHYDTAKAAVRKMRDVGIAVNGSDGVSLK